MKRIVIGVLATCIVLMLPMAGNADPTSVPHFLNYQSLLYDDGGNLVANGPAGITFKITDAAGNVLYEERQTPDVVNGAVSAVIGNGLDGGGAPMGGVPASVLTPDSSRYLEVTVDGYPPETAMEIVSVPYAVYAEKALGAAEGAIDGAALANKSITIDHLADGLISDLATQMGTAGLIATRTDLTNLQTTYRGTTGASTIGVTGGFVYSGSNNLQGVLQDLDRAIQSRQAGVDAIQTTVNTHTTSNVATAHPTGNWPIARLDTDIATQGELNAEAAARAAADAAEAGARGGKDEELEVRLEAVEGASQIPLSAWGTVDCDADPTMTGENATVSHGGVLGMCRVTFVTAKADTNYAVSISSPNKDAVVTNKTLDGFTAGVSGTPSVSFDFVVAP